MKLVLSGKEKEVQWQRARGKTQDHQKSHMDTTGFQPHHWLAGSVHSTAYENVDSSSVPLHTRHLSSGKDQTLITYVVLDLYLKHYLLEISCNDLPPSLALAVICSTSHQEFLFSLQPFFFQCSIYWVSSVSYPLGTGYRKVNKILLSSTAIHYNVSLCFLCYFLCFTRIVLTIKCVLQVLLPQ